MKNNCRTCIGSGFIIQEEEICKICYGKKCIYCKSTGYKKTKYNTCNICDGSGTMKNDNKTKKVPNEMVKRRVRQTLI